MAEMFDAIVYAIPYLMGGLGMTLLVSLIVVALSLVVGLLLGVGLIYGPWPLRWLIRLLTDCIRGIPILVLIFAVYYGLPPLGLNLSSFWAAVLALTLFKTAQVIEYVRGAVSSIPRGQMEAAKSIGLIFSQRLRYVIFPQATRRFLPPWLNGVTNVIRGLVLEAHGYKVRVTEFTGLEHTMKNELILAERHQRSNAQARGELDRLIDQLGVKHALLDVMTP